jgi:hypothetical protein
MDGPWTRTPPRCSALTVHPPAAIKGYPHPSFRHTSAVPLQLPLLDSQSAMALLPLPRSMKRASSARGHREVPIKVPLISDPLSALLFFPLSSPVHPRSYASFLRAQNRVTPPPSMTIRVERRRRRRRSRRLEEHLLELDAHPDFPHPDRTPSPPRPSR